MTLQTPVEPMLAQAAEMIPPPGLFAAGVAYEQKFDGHRMLIFTPSEPGGRVLLQTRRGTLVQDRFPDLVAAAEQLPPGLVLDGEVLVWDPEAGRLSFEGLQRRAAARARTAPALAARLPACPPTSWRSTFSRARVVWSFSRCRTGSAGDGWRFCSRRGGCLRRGRCAR